MDKQQKLEINAINMMAIKSEKIKWSRYTERMNKILQKIEPIEDKILDLLQTKQPYLDEIELLRLEMIDMCVHPKHLLIHNGNHITCKFCNKMFSIPTKKREPDGIKTI